MVHIHTYETHLPLKWKVEMEVNGKTCTNIVTHQVYCVDQVLWLYQALSYVER